MTTPAGIRKTCPQGHVFYKSSDCPTCPTCEAARKSPGDFATLRGAPARRALEAEGITSVEQLADFSESEILNLHGIGKTSLPPLRAMLAEKGLAFRKD
jgi:predicted RecB family nuclease